MTTPPPTTFPQHRGYEYLPNFWEHYARMPELYHRFAISSDAGVEHLNRIQSLEGQRILDVASGTGRSAFAMAKYAERVVGVEPADGMRSYSLRLKDVQQTRNVEFLSGSAWDLPGSIGSFDLATSFHGPPFFESPDHEANVNTLRSLVKSLEAALTPGGVIAFITAIPGWTHPYAELDPRTDSQPLIERQLLAESALAEEGFEASDETLELDYETLDEALATYGFIYGTYAIDWLLERQASTVYFGNRVYVRRAQS